MALITRNDSHLPEGRDASTAKKIYLPGDVDDIKKKILLPDESKKILLSPMARAEAEQRRAQQGEELQIERPFNHKQRRWHLSFAARLRRRQRRMEARKQRRLDQVMYDVTANSQRFEIELNRAVRRNSSGKEIKAISRPTSIDIPIEGGYLRDVEWDKATKSWVCQAEPLRKSKKQLELEANVAVGAAPQPKIEKTKRLKGSWAPPKPKKEAVAAA